MREPGPAPELDIIVQDLRSKLVDEFMDCGKYCARAYYHGERDSDNHDASNALRVLGSLIGPSARDKLRDAYRADKDALSLYELRDGEESIEDRYALVAIRVAMPLLKELVDAGMGIIEE